MPKGIKNLGFGVPSEALKEGEHQELSEEAKDPVESPDLNNEIAVLKKQIAQLAASQNALSDKVDAKEEEDEVKEALTIKGSTSGVNFKNEPRYEIRIELQENEPLDEKVGVNGVVFQIWRGFPVIVPECVVKVLQNAVKTTYYFEENSDRRQPPVRRSREGMAVPFSILRGPF